MKKPKILVVGSFVMDLIAETPRFPNAGETLLGTAFSTASGGKGANQAVQAARLGATVSMVGMVGSDLFGKEMIDSVSTSGVNTEHVMITDQASSAVGHIQIEKNADSVQNRILVIPGANMLIQPKNVAFLEKEIANYDLVMLQQEIPLAINRMIVQYAEAAGTKIMLNPAPFVPLPAEDYAGLTFVSPNETQAEAMVGFEVHTLPEAQKALAKMNEIGISNPMITMGSLGAVCYWNGEMVFEASLPDLPVKDPTAAGDSFVAAFCSAIAAGCSVRNAMVFAKHTAGITVCHMGAQPSLPHGEQVFASIEASGAMNDELYSLKEVLIG